MAGFFTGIPAPAGAGLAMAPFYLGFLGLIGDGATAAPFILPYIAAVAAGMVSRMPTYSAKGTGQRISRDLVLPILAGVVTVAVLLIAFTWEVLTAMAVAYIALLPLGVRSYQRQKKAWEERMAATQAEV
jgi:CDP-diacylglycerol--serine O-phosphatidyltransferase